MTADPRVTVVIPVLDGAHVLNACLDALAGQREVADVEVVVVDNGSTDGTAALAAAHPVVTRTVVEPRRGSYAARNAGIAVASGEVLAFTDADCRPDPWWLRRGLDALRDADLVGGEVRADRSPRPTVWERYDRATYLDQGRAVRDEHYAATANLLVRSEAFRQVGCFDAALVSSGDLEWGRRATSTGLRLVHAPDAVVLHLPRTTGRATWRLQRRLGVGWRQLARQGLRPPAWREPALRVPLRWAVGRVWEDGLGRQRIGPAAVHATVLAARWTGRLLGDRRGAGQVATSRSAARMRAWWESAAQSNAAWYVDTSLDFDDPDMDRFWRTGEAAVADALDGAPAQPPGAGLAVEIGSGLGRICRALSRRGFAQVVGVDISPTMVRRARELVDEPGVRFELGDGQGLGAVGTGTADLVLTFTVLQHIPDGDLVAGYLREAARVLRPGGLLVAQWNGTDGARRWALRRAVLGSRLGRRRPSADPYGREVAEFLGCRIPEARMRMLLADAGLELAGLRGQGTLFSWLWAVQPLERQ